MARRLRLQNRKDKRRFQRPVRDIAGEPNSDGFSMKFAGGRGILELAQEAVAEGIEVTALEMLIDNIAFPFDVTHGVRGLSSRRLQLYRLEMDISLKALQSQVARRVENNSWIHSVDVVFYEDHISLSLLYGPEATAVPLSFRLIPVSFESSFAFIVDDVRCYGAMPGSLVSIAVLCMSELSGFTMTGTLAVPNEPTKQILLRILPPRGWRLPAYNNMQVKTFSLQPRRCQLALVALDGIDNRPDALRSLLSMTALKRLEALRQLRDVDTFIGKGELNEARSLLASMLAQTPDSPTAYARLAMLNILDPARRDTTLQQLREKLSQWHDRPDVLAVMAHGAALAGDVEGEVLAQSRLFELGTPAEKLIAAMRIAELIGDEEPARAVAYLEQAASVRRDNPDALLALMEMYALQKDVSKLQPVIQRWIAIHTKKGQQAAAHLEAGRILLSVSEWSAAASHFKSTLLSDPKNNAAAWGIAAALAGRGDVQRAIDAYEQLAGECRRRNLPEKEAEALAAIGELWLKHGEPELAVSRLQEAIAIRHDSQAQMNIAIAMASLGRYDQAVMHYEEALETAASQDDAWARGALTLARLFFEQLEDLDAARHWIEQASKVAAVRTQARELQIQVLEKQRRWTELAVALERDLLRDGENASLDKVAHLARARVAVGELTSAIATIESALEKNPDHGPLLDVYIDALRRQMDDTRLIAALQRRVPSLPIEKQAPMLREIGDLILSVENDAREAMIWYRDALTISSDDVNALAGLVETMRQTSHEELPTALNRLVGIYESRGDLTNLANARVIQAELLLKAGKAQDAVALLQEVLPRLGDDQKSDVLMRIAQSLIAQGEYAPAREILANLSRRGNVTDTHLILLGEAEAAYYLGDYEAAYEAAIAAGSGPVALRAKALRVLVDAAVHLGKEREALDMLGRVAENLETEEASSLWEMGAELAFETLGDAKLASEFYENILRVSPGSERARNRLIAMLEKSGHRVALARCLVRFYGDKPSGTSEVKRAADFFLADGLYDEAVMALRKAHEFDRDVESARMLANALTKSGKPGSEAEALRILTAVASDDDNSRDMLLEQYEARGDLDAMVTLLTASKSNDNSQEAKRLEKLARLMIQKGDQLAAAGYLLEAATVVKSRTALRHLYAEVMEIAVATEHPQLYARAVDGMSPIASDVERAELKLALAVQYYRSKMYQDAEQLLEPADSLRALPMEQLLQKVQEHQEMKPLVFRVLQYALEQERWSDAEHLLTLRLFLENEDHHFELLMQRAEIRSKYLDDSEGAAADWMEIGEHYHQQPGNEAQAMTYYQRALALNGSNMQALLFLGEHAFAQRDFKKLAELLKMATVPSWHPRVTLWKATVAEEAGLREVAFQQFEELMDKAPQMDEANEGYLRTVPEEGYEQNVLQALAVVRRKGALGQMSASVHRKAARAYLDSSEMDKARRHLEIALSLDPLDKSSLLLLARVYEASGQSSARAYTLEKIADLVTGDEQIDCFVASGRVFLDDLNDPARAASLFMRAAAVSRDEPDVLLGLADCAWMSEEWASVTSNLERLRVVAPHLAIDPNRVYRFALSLSKTGEWPAADVAELLERTIPELGDNVRQDAAALLEKLKAEAMMRKGR